ncbi:MAG: SDR family NAD(P)-dependent oxidoreductase, partial [Bradymonadaceae bacterium]
MQEPKNEPLADKHAIVTGASRGIGAATAAKLAALGADISLMSRSRETLEKRCDELDNAIGGNYLAVPVDVTDRQRVEEAMRQAREQLGPADILVNNAGAAVGKPFTELSAEDWESMMAVNLDSVFYCTKAVLSGMLERGTGRIVNMASTTGLTGYKYVAHYAASKHGVVGLTKSLAKEVAEFGMTVNAVC